MGQIKGILYGLFGLNVVFGMYNAGAYAHGKRSVSEGKVFAISNGVSALVYGVLIYLMMIDW